MIFQLRYFRLFGLDTDHVVGYVFPKLNQKTIVTEVRLEFSRLTFRASFKYLKKEEVIESIEAILNEQCNLSKFEHLRTAQDYFIGLNHEDLDYIQKIVKSDSKLKQVRSAYSILVRDENYYYKIVPKLGEILTLKNLWIKITKFSPGLFKHLVLPTEIFQAPQSDVSLFRFEAQLYPHLTSGQCLCYLSDFVTYAIQALEEFHQFGYAHTDVRLPNFVLSHDFEIKLIDFDRAQNKSNRNTSSTPVNSLKDSRIWSFASHFFNNSSILDESSAKLGLRTS